MEKAAEAATLADEYVFTHRGDYEYRAREDVCYRDDGSSKFRPADKHWEEGAGPRHGKPERAT